MKHVLIFTSLALFSQLGQAQIPSDTLRPKAKEKQITIALNNNNSGSLLFKKYTSATFAYRLGLSGGYQSSTNEYTDFYVDQYNVGLPNRPLSNTSISKNTSLSIYLNFGIQKSFGIYKNFEPYIGIDLGVGNNFNSQKEERTTNNGSLFVYYTDNNSNYYTRSVIKTKRETKSDFLPVFSLLPFIGFNYYIAERFALGVEYKLLIASLSTKQNIKTTNTFEFSDGKTDTYDTYNSKSTSINGNFTGTTNITATFFIGK